MVQIFVKTLTGKTVALDIEAGNKIDISDYEFDDKQGIIDNAGSDNAGNDNAGTDHAGNDYEGKVNAGAELLDIFSDEDGMIALAFITLNIIIILNSKNPIIIYIMLNLASLLVLDLIVYKMIGVLMFSIIITFSKGFEDSSGIDAVTGLASSVDGGSDGALDSVIEMRNIGEPALLQGGCEDHDG